MPPALTSLGYGIVSPCGKIMPDVGNSITNIPETGNVNIAVKVLLALKARFLRWRLKRSLSAYDILQAQRLAAEYWEQPECRVKPSVYSVTRIASNTNETMDDISLDAETTFIETIPETAATDTTVAPENTDSIKLKYN